MGYIGSSYQKCVKRNEPEWEINLYLFFLVKYCFVVYLCLFYISDDINIVNGIKHQLCYVAENFQSEQIMFEGATKEEYKLPDGTKISLGIESFTVPEAILQPSLTGKGNVSLNSNMQSQIYTRYRKYLQ